MISRPDSVEGWSLDLIREICASGINENDWFDLKADLQGDAEQQRKSVAAFANTMGGFLVFGVTNQRTVIGVSRPELPRDFGNKLNSGVNPSVPYRFGPPMPVADGRYIWICEVPRSLQGPHAVLLRDHWGFLKRTESGSCVSMSVEEIRNAFLDAGRRTGELAWLRADVDRIGKLAWDLLLRMREEPWPTDVYLSRFEAGQLRTLLVSVFHYLDHGSGLVSRVHDLVDACMKVDRILAEIAPGRHINAGTRQHLQHEAKEQLARVTSTASQVLDGLKQAIT